MVVCLLVEPKIADNEAYSAWEALGRLGFRGRLLAVRRAWVWEIHVTDPVQDSDVLRERLARCDVLANPNKHSVTFAEVPRLAAGEVAVAVKDRDDGVAEEVCSILHNRLGFSDLERVERVHMWILKFKDDAVEAAGAAARALLVNPHFQECEIIEGSTP
jgi:hypothetical protein